MSSLKSILAIIQEFLNIILGILLVVDVTECILNYLVILQKRLRSNPCPLLFTTSSSTNIIVLIYNIVLLERTVIHYLRISTVLLHFLSFSFLILIYIKTVLFEIIGSSISLINSKALCIQIYLKNYFNIKQK
jgi:hypothetical protein